MTSLFRQGLEAWTRMQARERDAREDEADAFEAFCERSGIEPDAPDAWAAFESASMQARLDATRR